jgi:hypothetical protein
MNMRRKNCRYTSVLRNVISGELLTKQAMRKTFLLYTKNTYIPKQLPNLVTAGTEALVASGNKFLHAYVKEVCCLWAQPHCDTFHQLVVEALWSQPVHQVGKQVVVAQSEIRAVRRVVRQLPVEMHQQCWSVRNCIRACIVMEECQYFTPFVLNSPMQFF